MSRNARLGILTTALAVGAVVATSRPVSAQQAGGTLQQTFANVSFRDTSDSSFLVANMAPSAEAGAQQSSSRGGGSEGFGIGAKVGPLFTSYSAATQNFDSNSGLEFGIWFGGNRGGTVGVMGEIMYAKKKQALAGLTGTTLQFLEIPILMRINVGSRSRNGVSVYGLIGPAFDINLKAKQGNLDVKSNYESLDIGILGGVGVEITRFLVEGRINRGLKNVLKGNGSANNDVKTNSFALLFGVRFN